MDANDHILKAIFAHDRQLTAPLFQRPYVWEKERQWEPLWDDIRAIAEALLAGDLDVKPHFLGAVVLDQVRTPTGQLETRCIIDGQQRLATLQVLFAAFRDVCLGHLDDERVPQAIEKLMFNDDPMLDGGADRFKVLPTNVDRQAYRLALSAGSPEAAREMVTDTSALTGRLFDAYRYYFGVLSEWLQEDEEETGQRAEELLRALREKLVMVVIDIDDEDDAQMIFETLNARGTPLLPSDLVKNYLFREAEAEGLNVERLHREYWKPFDDDMDFWRGETSYGRRKRERIDLFLQHYLTLMRADEVSVEKLFNEFQEFASENGYNAEWHLARMHDYGSIFRSFLERDMEGRERVFFSRLNRMETSTAFPFLLGLYHDLGDGEKNKEERVAILEDIESFLVRRMVCGLTARNYNRFFLDLIGTIREDGVITHDEVRKFLLAGTGESVRWPDDEEFRDAWMNRQLFRRVKRDRLRMILHTLDDGLRDGKTEDYNVDFRQTVEHIMPRSWEVHWPLPEIEGETAEERLERRDRRNHLKHTIGNLTMLTKKLNPAVSNGPFELKRREINQFSILSLNRFLHHTDEWDEEAIHERSARLFEIAREVWAYPEEAPED